MILLQSLKPCQYPVISSPQAALNTESVINTAWVTEDRFKQASKQNDNEVFTVLYAHIIHV